MSHNKSGNQDINNGVTSKSFSVPFNESLIETWLIQFKIFLQLNNIDHDSNNAKMLLIQALPTNILAQSGDSFFDLPTFNDMTAALKRTCGITTNRALDEILGPTLETSQTPRQIVNTLLNTISTALPETSKETKERIVTTRLIASLPHHHREIVSVISDQGLEKVHSVAERLQHITTTAPRINHVSSPPCELSQRLDNLERNFSKLLSIVEQQNHRPRQQEKSRNRSASSHRYNNNNDNNTLCYYHQKFGNSARKCTCHNNKDHPNFSWSATKGTPADQN